MLPREPIAKWALLAQDIRFARLAVLQRYGMNDYDYKEAEIAAIREMPENEIEVQNVGKVCKRLEYGGENNPPICTGLIFVPFKKG